ncbi:MAG: hypothetical protein KJ896_03885, partial [Nanoarchaeota archaeon]|nr:hypothetical protein [Nanoarchaeota archaeon]
MVSKKSGGKNTIARKVVGNKKTNSHFLTKIKSLKLEHKLFYTLLITTLLLASLNVAQAKGYFLPDHSGDLVTDGVVNLGDWTLEQKIAQMVITHGGSWNKEVWQKLQLGGIHLFAMETEEAYTQTINEFQEEMEIPFFVTIDLEG